MIMTKVRKAKIDDAEGIHRLITQFAEVELMLPRSLNSIYEMIRSFYVVYDNDNLVACCALSVSWAGLAEIKCLAVDDKFQKRGLGRQLLTASMGDAGEIGITEVFGLTYQADFFIKQGFEVVEKSSLPHKIWTECINCSKFPACDEVAVLKKI
jgi:amino-acid N-acetyltransferase